MRRYAGTLALPRAGPGFRSGDLCVLWEVGQGLGLVGGWQKAGLLSQAQLGK